MKAENFSCKKPGCIKHGIISRKNIRKVNFTTHFMQLVATAFFLKDKFLTLGGFSPVFEPFYWEDADLSYRAMKRGWSVYFDPQCKVIHDHSSTIRSLHSNRKISIIQTRNKILFFWKNVSSPLLWFIHISGVSFRILTSWIGGDFIFYAALYKATHKIPNVVKSNSLEKVHWKKSDRELFKYGRF